MKLLLTPTSPYGRKARIIVLEKKLACEIEMVNPWENEAAVMENNPLRKIPILIADCGSAILDSRVICEYLAAKEGGPQILPEDAANRLYMQTRVAIAEGAMDAALAIIMAGRVSPNMATDAWKSWLMDKTAAALDHFEKIVTAESFDLSDITLGCLLGTLDFRMPDYDWKSSRPALAAHWQRLSARPSFAETVPVA